MCFLIGLQVCFHSATKHKNDLSNVVDCLSPLSLCYKTENKKFYKSNKTCCPYASIACWKPRLHLGFSPRYEGM